MKAITLRNLPPELAKIVRKKAEQKGMSINKAVISLLEESTGTSRKKREKKVLYHDLDTLAGLWTKEEALEFEKAVAAQRTIEPDLWK